MKCKEVMKTRVVSIAHNDSVKLAAAKMRDTDVGFIPVTDSHGKPEGIITDRDIVLRAVADGLPLDTPIENIMTRGVIGVSQEADLGIAEEMMSRHQKSRVLCLDEDGYIAGVISLSDIPAHESARRAGTVFGKVAQRESTPGIH
jgi:CBS domain-containing protein